MSLPFDFLDRRPIVIALVGSNGSGKSTFYESYLSDAGLRFINAVELSSSLGLSPYESAELATSIRRELVNQRESFIFETVLSDPVGETPNCVGWTRNESQNKSLPKAGKR